MHGIRKFYFEYGETETTARTTNQYLLMIIIIIMNKLKLELEEVTRRGNLSEDTNQFIVKISQYYPISPLPNSQIVEK